MKKMYKLSLLICLIPTLLIGKANSQNEASKFIKEVFPLTQGSYVEINNQYGDIEVNNWDKDSVSFEVEVLVRSDRDIDLDEILDLIDVNFRANSNYVLAETKWSEEVNFFRKKMQNLKQGIGSSGNIEVNYIVHLPKNQELEIINKFGNVYLGDHDGALNVTMNYGDFRARKLSNVKKISVKYGKFKVRDLIKGSLEFTAVKSAAIITAQDIMINSSSSEIEIDQVEKLNIISKHDDIRLENVAVLKGSVALTDIRVSNLNDEANMTTKFGSMYVRELKSSATYLNLESNKTDIFINFASDFQGDFDLNLDDEERLKLFSKIKVNSGKYVSDGVYKVDAQIGDSGKSKININTTKGFLSLGE